MARAKLAQIELWSNVACASGVRRAVVERPLAASAALRLRGDSRAQFDVPLDDAAIGDITGGAVARFLYADQTWEEWRIDRLSTEVTPNGEVRRVTCAAPLWDLGAVGPITEYDSLGNPTFSGARYAITPADLITTVILPWLSANGITWVSLGTIDPTAPLDLEWNEVTPLGLLHQLEDATGCELQLRRNGTTDYKIDLLTAINGSQPVADLREGKNLFSTVLTQDATQQYSRLTGLGAADPAGRRAVMGRAVWEVTAVNTTTDRLTLTDPEGGDDPILEDDQLNGLYLYDLPSGATDQILDTLVATQQVQVADASGYLVGDLLEVRLSAGTGTYKDNAALLTSLSRPSITPARTGTLDRPDLFGERNLVRNGWFTDWINGAHAAPDGWTLHSGALDHDLREATYAELGPYTVALRFQPYQVISPPLGIGVTTITLDSGYFYVGQTVEVFGYSGTVETFTVTAKTSTSITISGSGTGYAHSLTSYVRAVGQTFPLSPVLPYAWPGILSELVRAPVTGGAIFWAQAKLMLAGLPAGQYRALLTIERYSSANVLLGTVVAQTTVMDQWVTLGCSIQAAAGEQLRMSIALRDDPTYPSLVPTFSVPSTGRLLVDGACLTQTDYQPSVIPNYSHGNAFWQAVNRALASNSAGTSYEVSIVDLTALDPVGWPDDELLLGGSVRVNNARAGVVNQLLRIVELQRPDLFDPAPCAVVLNARRTDLTEIIDRALRGGGGTTATPGGGSGGPSGTPLASATVPVKIPFHAAGKPTAPYTLPLGTHAAAVTEVDSGLRTWCETTGAVKLRLETVVDTVGAANAELAVRYSTDGGSTWAFLDGVDGPLVSIAATGAVAGNFIVPVVRGDVLLQLVMRGGDSVASPIVRNTMLYVFYAVLASPVPTPTPPTAFPAPTTMCGLSTDAIQGDNFAGGLGMVNYADVAEFFTEAGTGRKIYYNGIYGTANVDVAFDPTDVVGGHRTLALTYDETDNRGPFWRSQWSDGVAPTEAATSYDDYWYRIALKIPTAFQSIPTPSYSPSIDNANGGVPSSAAGAFPGNFQRGANLLALYPYDIFTNGLLAIRDISLNLSIKGDGRLYLEAVWQEQPVKPSGPIYYRWIQQDIGAASLLADDAWHDLIVHVRYKPGDQTSIRVTVYIGDVCELGLSALAEVDVGPHLDLVNMVGRSVTGPWGIVDVPLWILPTTSNSSSPGLSAFGPHVVKVGRHEMVPTNRNANPFGVV